MTYIDLFWFQIVQFRSIYVFACYNMSIPFTFFATYKVTRIALKFLGVFGVKIILNRSICIEHKKTPKSFHIKYIKYLNFTITNISMAKSDPYLYALMSVFTTF